MLKQLPPAQRELLRKAVKDQIGPTKPASEETEESDDVVSKSGTPLTASTAVEPPVVRLQAGDTLLITFRPIEKTPTERKPDDAAAKEPSPSSPPLSVEEKAAQLAQREEQEKLREALIPKNPVFVLDQFGALTLNNIARFPLAGLSEEEASERLSAEPVFQGLRVRVRRLPLEPELKRFGHDLFVGAPKTFAPATDIPVPVDYVIGPGDTVIVQLTGKESAEHELIVTREGVLLFPGIGPISVAGMRFSQLQKELANRVQRQMIGVRASVTLGRLRSIRVFVLGDVLRPGSYTVSSLSTLTNALFVSGGVKPIGSLRDIQLKRAGEVVGRLDLYDLLIRGDTRGDVRLQPGDVIFVPPAGTVVGISGKVRRPAFYELKHEKSLEDVLAMAGGLLPEAFPQATRIDRVGAGRPRSVVSADLTRPEELRQSVQDGDVVRIYGVTDRVEQSVRLVGWVTQEGNHQWQAGMRLSDVISSLDDFKPEADTNYVLIRRERADDRQIEMLGANPRAAIERPRTEADLLLQPQDEVRVFGIHEDRATLIKPMLERARSTYSPTRPAREVAIDGAVHHPGRYPWSDGMTVGDLIRAGGGLTERAYTLEAELTRYVLGDGKPRELARKLVRLDTSSGRADDSQLTLQPYDQIVIRRVPHWDEEGVVEILGEVRFPGRYPIARGERLSNVLARAGGFTDAAHPRAAVFLRESVRQREQEYLERLIGQLERDLLVLRTGGPEVGVRKDTALLEGEALLRQMRAAKATGRMVIKLDAVASAKEDYDVVMQSGDKLVIPSRPDEVTVVGEVYYPTSHVYVNDRGRDDYVSQSGGVTERGNKRAIYVVHADGSVSPPRGWFGREVGVGPGDTIIVPVKVDRIGNLKLFTDISTILFQLAVTAAALDAIGVL